MSDEQRVRVLWLVKGFGQGGMERLLVTHARFGDHERFDYRAAYLVDRPHSVIDELVALDVPVTKLGSGNGADPRWLQDLVRMARQDRIDFVHVHSPMPAALARPVLRLALPRTRLIYTEHNNWGRYSKPTRWANMATYPLSHKIYAVSDDCRDSVPLLLRKKVQTLIHGIDLVSVGAHEQDRDSARAELGIADDTVVVGTVANLRKQKNYPLLLEVASKLTAENPKVVFLAVGQGPLESELRALHSQLGLGHRFRFLGFRDDVHRIMSAFDILCFASDHEGLPVALMESKALGLPVVATEVGGIPDAVAQGVDGLLVPPRSPEALSRSLETLISSPKLRKALAVAARESARRFDAMNSVSAQEEAYRQGKLGTSCSKSRKKSARH